MPKTLAERFAANVNDNGPVPAHRPELGPCWVWTGTPDSSGYGQIHVDKMYGGGRSSGQERASRVAFFLAFGRWPDPCALHHCDNRSCVKAWPDELGPAHIYEGTVADNARDRHEHGASWQEKRTHCPKGHPYDETNTIRSKGRIDERRNCRTCTSIWRAARYAARIAAGICAQCPSPASPGRSECEACRRLSADKAARRHKASHVR